MTRLRFLLSIALAAAAPGLSGLAQGTAPARQGGSRPSQPAAPSGAKAAPAIKVAEKPIPAFTVWQLRPGESTESQVTPVQLNPSGYWLMLYVEPSSKVSLDLLSQVQTLTQTPALDRTGAVIQSASAGGAQPVPQYKLDAAHLVIVVANATGSQLAQFALNYPGLASASWAHDASGAAAKTLGIRGTPHLFGMREGQQRWQLPDNLKPSDVEPVLTSWLALNRLPANKLVRQKVKTASAAAPNPVPAPSNTAPATRVPQVPQAPPK